MSGSAPASGARAVLFDLDGTLVDSAPDLVAALDVLLAERGGKPVAYASASQAVSKGARTILKRGFPDYSDAEIEPLLPRYLEIYSAGIAIRTRPYPGVESMLDKIEQAGWRWGVVTNKPGWLARPLLAQLKLDQRCSALVSGDCLPVKKPDPAPLLRACAMAGVAPERCIYVGDDLRDIEAGIRAGLRTVAVTWGYLDGQDPHAWNADFVIATPQELLTILALD